MTTRRFEGRNLEEALEGAATALGVEPWRLSYHVVLEKRGFLGGTKRVVVEAEVNPAAVAREEIEDPGQARQPAPQHAGRPVPEPAPESPRGRERRGGRHDRDRPQRPPEEAMDYEADEEQLSTPVAGQSPELSSLQQWCEELLRLTGLRLQVRIEERDDRIEISLRGRDQSRLIARGGELLDSIQVIANKALVGKEIERPLEFDTANFKQEREKELSEQARELAEVVRKENRERLLPAMSPVERRIVHLALQDDEAVVTESRGDGFLKRVAIVPRSSEQEPVEDQPE